MIEKLINYNYKQFIIPGILLLITLGVFFWQPSKSHPLPLPASVIPASVAANPVAMKATGENSANDLNYGRDPFAVQDSLTQIRRTMNDDVVAKPVDENTLLLKQIRLNGIVRTQDQVYCFINGQILLKGQEVRGFRVAEILEEKVVLTKEQKKYTLARE